MKCPHCLVAFHTVESKFNPFFDVDGGWVIRYQTCPTCNKLIIFLDNIEQRLGFPIISTTLIRPKGFSRSPVPPEVPADIAEDYIEACLVLDFSPKASAALSRRCLQNLLRSAANVNHGNLANEIQQVLDSSTLPTHIEESIDGIRNIGNFAAHATKSQQSGEIIAVEPGEAEWNLDVLEMLFDFYYVQPAITAKKRADLNAKLASVGKPPMK